MERRETVHGTLESPRCPHTLYGGFGLVSHGCVVAFRSRSTCPRPFGPWMYPTAAKWVRNASMAERIVSGASW